MKRTSNSSREKNSAVEQIIQGSLPRGPPLAASSPQTKVASPALDHRHAESFDERIQRKLAGENADGGRGGGVVDESSSVDRKMSGDANKRLKAFDDKHQRKLAEKDLSNVAEARDKTGTVTIITKMCGGSLTKALVVTLAIISYSAHSVLTEGAKSDGTLSFDVAAVVAMSELVKLVVTYGFLSREGNLPTALTGMCNVREQTKAAVPALLYGFNNQLAFWMLLQMDPGTMQLLSNFKVVPTVAFSVIFLQRKIKFKQYKALGLLMLGTVGLHSADGSLHVGSTYAGIMQAIIYCIVSAVAGIWCEKILREGSLHVQNFHLYIWGCVVNTIWLLFHLKPDSISSLANGWAVANILNQALTGLLISAILKFAGNVDKIFIVAASVVPAGLSAYFCFGYEITTQWLVSAITIVVAISIYVTRTNISFFNMLLIGTVAAVYGAVTTMLP